MNSNRKSVALVTGASSGIGKAIARQLLADGYTVYAAARHPETMADLAGLGAIPITMDVTSDQDVANAVTRIAENHDGLTVLVNNAGFGCYGALEDTSIEDARYQLEVNVLGMARLIRAFLPAMRRHQRGYIVNIASMGGKIYTPLGAWYHATKHAVEGLSDCLRLELAPFGIKVIIIEPGIIDTNFSNVMLPPMMARSGNTDYARLAKAVESVTKSAYAAGSGSHPSVVARTVSDALKAGNPRTRYPCGKMARLLIFIRKFFGDRIYDRLVLSALGRVT